MNELDKLREMLKEANIPFINKQELWAEGGIPLSLIEAYGKNGEWKRNQVTYGDGLVDCVCHYGSLGARKGLIEVYGALGIDKEGESMIMTAQEVFDIIKKDWERKNK